jgi:hypothetical protein
MLRSFLQWWKAGFFQDEVSGMIQELPPLGGQRQPYAYPANQYGPHGYFPQA